MSRLPRESRKKRVRNLLFAGEDTREKDPRRGESQRRRHLNSSCR